MCQKNSTAWWKSLKEMEVKGVFHPCALLKSFLHQLCRDWRFSGKPQPWVPPMECPDAPSQALGLSSAEKSGVHQVRLVGNVLWFLGFLYIQTVLGKEMSKPYHFQKLSHIHHLYLSATLWKRQNAQFAVPFPKGKQFHPSPLSNGTKNHLIGLCSRTVSGVNISPTQTMHYVSKKSIKFYHTFAACFISPKGFPCNDPVLKMPILWFSLGSNAPSEDY